MKTIKVRPVLVPQEKATWPNCLWIGKTSGNLRLDTSYNNKPRTQDPTDNSMLPQQLILISLEDEKIEKGDKFIELDLYETRSSYIGKIYTCDIGDTGTFILTKDINFPFPENCKRVIATQSQLSPEYISKFVEEYNSGYVKDLEIEMEVDVDDKRNWYEDCPSGKYWEDEPTPPSKNNLYTNALYLLPKLTPEGYITIVDEPGVITYHETPVEEDGELVILDESWEANLAIKNVPELAHVITSVRELRRYYIDGIQAGYEARKSENESLYSLEDLKSAFNAGCRIGSTEGMKAARGELNLTRFEDWFNKNKRNSHE